MAKKTNKTSHVMDLLTNGASGEANDPSGDAAVSAGTAAQGKKGDVQSHTVTPTKVTVVDEGSQNDRLSQEILNKLSEELEADLQQNQAAPSAADLSADLPETKETPAASNRTMSPEEIAAAFASVQAPLDPEPEPVPQPEPANAQETPAGSASRTMSPEEIAAAFASVQAPLDPEPEPAPQPEPPEPAPEPKPEPAPAPSDNREASKKAHHSIIPKSQLNETLGDEAYHFVNVMEQLILRQDINAFLKQYDVCTCRRCMSDVCALALTGLPSKYVVASKDSLAPLLSYYESKYKIYMLTELIKACNKVRESPRHNKK